MAQEALEPIYSIVGARIRETRETRGLTQAALGDRVGLTRGSIANIEAGQQRILLHTLEAIATSLGTNLIDILSKAAELDRSETREETKPPRISSTDNVPASDAERILQSIRKRE